jgi:hypothetical protein
MNRTRTLGAVACAAVLALSVVGCGSSDDKDSDSKTLSASDFKEQANALCKTANTELAELQSGADTTTTEGQEAFVDAFGARITKLVDGIEELEAPDSLADGVDEMLDAVKGVVSDLEDDGISVLSGTIDPFTDADAKATELGLDECAGNTDSTPLASDDYKTQANAVCQTANEALSHLTEGVADQSNPTEAELTGISEKLVDAVSTEADSLRALSPPAEMTDGVEAWLTAFEAVVATAKDEGGKFFDRDKNPFSATNAQAGALGLEDCSTTAE